MSTCLECGFARKDDAGACPRCGAGDDAAKTVAPTEVLSTFEAVLSTGLATGHLLARKYEIRKKLGGGASGWVYLAHDVGLDKDVAVKILHVADPSAMNTVEATKRFLREARALARLDEHPNIVRVMNVDEENGVPYFVMEYVPGGTLHDLL